jgi:glycerol-3-phosphate dehydrogenase (NAD(P)+)
LTEIGVIGAGAWGTAFTIHLARKGYNVLLWVYEDELYETLETTRENTMYLPAVALPQTVSFSKSLQKVARSSNDIVLATPSFALRKTIVHMADILIRKNILVLTKGLETGTRLRVSQVVDEVLHGDSQVAVLSGPSFAQEVAAGAFTSVVIASNRRDCSSYFQQVVHDENFRVYTSEDMTGVELGGAMKNVMAIGAGIIEGLKLGTNTQAAFITRALAEIKRLGRALGAKETTFMGLSGVGDLVLTSYGRLSRNRSFGMELAQGKEAKAIIDEQLSVVEGYYAIDAAYRLSRELGVDMPITEELYRVVYEGKDLRTSLHDIKQRALKEEEV